MKYYTQGNAISKNIMIINIQNIKKKKRKYWKSILHTYGRILSHHTAYLMAVKRSLNLEINIFKTVNF